jgi:hypothetical protein
MLAVETAFEDRICRVIRGRYPALGKDHARAIRADIFLIFLAFILREILVAVVVGSNLPTAGKIYTRLQRQLRVCIWRRSGFAP